MLQHKVSQAWSCNHANFCGISKCGIVLQHFCVTSVEYSSMSSMVNQLYLILWYILWTITLFDHSSSLYPKWKNVQERSKQCLNFTHHKFLLWGTILAQPPNFKGQIVTEVREYRNFTLWLKPCKLPTFYTLIFIILTDFLHRHAYILTHAGAHTRT